jgi:hypothetical protein
MEFTTPASYANTVVRVAGIATDGKLLIANTEGDVKHTETKLDAATGWSEPTSASYHWAGKSEDGKEVTADVAGPLGAHIDRVDVMAGTKPYIYQYARKMTIKIKVGDEVKEEEGTLFTEATFIS